MSTTSQFFSGGTTIKGIQRGVINFGASDTVQTATITSVTTGKTELRHMGSTGGAFDTGNVRLTLTNATTVTATRQSSSGTTAVVSWELTEWN